MSATSGLAPFGAVRIDITEAEILEDLCWPGLPPRRWRIPSTAHIDGLLKALERALWP